jgi:hypothetical protein
LAEADATVVGESHCSRKPLFLFLNLSPDNLLISLLASSDSVTREPLAGGKCCYSSR